MGVDVRSAARAAIQSRAKSLISDINYVREINGVIAKLVGPNANPQAVGQLRSLRFHEKKWGDRLASIEDELGINNSAETSMEAIGTNTAIEAQMAANEEYIASLERDIENTRKKLKSIKRKDRKHSEDHPVLEVAKKELAKAREFSKRFKLREDDSSILSKEEIMALNHEDRARMLSEHNKKNYSEEQQAVIDDLKASLGEDKVQKIIDAATLSRNIEGARNAFNYSVKHPDMLQGYINNIERYAKEQLKTEYNNRVYTNMKYAMELRKDVQSKIAYIHQDQVSSEVLDRYLHDYPEYEEAMRPLVPLLKTKEDLFELIMSKKDMPRDSRKNLIKLIGWLSVASPSREVFMSELNSWMEKNAESLTTEVSLLNNLIKESKELEQLRESTVTESIEEKIKRKEENKRKREEEERKKKAEEEERKRIAEEEKKQRESLTPDALDAQDFMDAANANTKEAYQKYLDNHPEGAYRDGARGGIWTIEGINPETHGAVVDAKNAATKVLENSKKQPQPTPPVQPVEDEKPKPTEAVEKPTEENPNIIKGDVEEIDITDEDEKPDPVRVELEPIEIGDVIPANEQVKQALAQDSDADISTNEIPKATQDLSNDSAQPDVLLGNSMFRYDNEHLKPGTDSETPGKLEPRKGKESNDSMSKFFNWMDAAGITYQHTIDVYLSDIAALDPKVKFIMVNPQNNSTNDQDMGDRILTAVEYTSEVARIYRNPGNNVIECDGTKYLIIGVTGFNRSSSENSERHLELWNFLKTERWRYFQNKENAGKRFYVDSTLETKIKSIGRGYYVHQQEGDSSVEYRKITDLLEGNRNPRETNLMDLKWGIVVSGEWVGINTTGVEVVTPDDIPNKNGRVYLLIKAANGKYIPTLVDSKSINEIEEGGLKNLINAKLEELANPDINIQKKALEELKKRIVFSKGTKLSITPAGVIRIDINGMVSEVDPKVPTFDKAAFIKRIYSLNPLVNITASTLLDEHSLRMYDAAGALTVNIAQLHTSNADYSIYAVDTASGNIIVHDPATGEIIPPNNGLSSTNLPVIPYRGHTYVKTDAGYTLDGKLVDDAWIIQKLDWMYIIMNTNPSLVKGKDEYYVLDNNPDKPVIIHYNTTNKIPKPIKSTYAKQLLAEIGNKVLQENARRALQNEEVKQQETETVTEDTSESGIAMLDAMNGIFGNVTNILGVIVDREKIVNMPANEDEVLTYGENDGQTSGDWNYIVRINNHLTPGFSIAVAGFPTEQEAKEYIAKNKKKAFNAIVPGGIETAPVEETTKPKTLSEVFGFSINVAELAFDPVYGERFEEILESKDWDDKPTDAGMLDTYLLGKMVDTSNVTSIEAFLDMLENCR